MLSSDRDAFRELTSTAAGHTGLIKNFYACIKSFIGDSDEQPIAGIFITGVSAVSLDSVTSGFNIAKNISADSRFNAMAGFTHDELSEVVDVLICGGIGGGAQTALKEAEIQLFGGVAGSADEAVQAYLAGDLAYDPDVHCSHHHHEQGHSCGDHACQEDKHGCAGNEDAGRA